ncbi:type II secretion system protein [Psychrosphaera aquimarina]|uniref:Type II secretion system protein n=1 Tax=Psychrosphaera aquimarina TaxID=2044854 RepID=A0ABU3R207_9GAMM|nr:type II secretion system protein [Psychrosphaera aquimarina]MDU0113715.1 type II secretion system protein [Psychrosphaera aquimarina]
MAKARFFTQTKPQGFSLIELVAVIVILGVLATASVRFIVFGTQIYVEANDRQVVLSKSRFAIERMTREIRGAIPNSVRVSSSESCIEFTPIKASGAYRDDIDSVAAPVSPETGNNMDVIGWLGDYQTGDRVYIYPTSSSDIYNSSSDKMGILGDPLDSGALPYTGISPQLNITFNPDPNFTEHSPKRRYYTADSSINYCLIANGVVYDLYRIVSTSFSASQLQPSDKNAATLLGGVLMAEGLTNNLSNDATHPFDISSSTLNRNSVVNLYLEFKTNIDENMFFNHEVHIPNVP